MVNPPAAAWRLAGDLASVAGLVRLSRWVVVAALAEFLTLRVLIRMGPMLPQRPEVVQAAEAVVFLGTVALNAAAILSLLGLLLVAGLTSSVALRGLLVAGVALSLARVVVRGQDLVFLLHSGVTLAAMSAAVLILTGARGRRILLGILLAIYAALAYPMLATAAARLGWRWPESSGLFFVAEGLAVGVPLLVYLAYRPGGHRGAALAALAAAICFGAAQLARPWLVWTLAQWTVGFTGFLPRWLYLPALLLFAYTALSLRHTHRLWTWGLILVALGGLRWDYTYLGGLSLFGFLLLAVSWEDLAPGDPLQTPTLSNRDARHGGSNIHEIP
jgi:hypothetical protein